MRVFKISVGVFNVLQAGRVFTGNVVVGNVEGTMCVWIVPWAWRAFYWQEECSVGNWSTWWVFALFRGVSGYSVGVVSFVCVTRVFTG